MNEKCSLVYRLRSGDFDHNDNLTLFAMLDLFQDIAGKHADDINMGFKDMIAKNQIWVLIRSKLKVYDRPSMYDEVLVTTWPRPKGRFDFDREYTMESKDGRLLAKCSSKWVVVNVETRRIVLGNEVSYPFEPLTDRVFDTDAVKIRDFDTTGFNMVESKTRVSDLDHNGHVNNACYIRHITDSIPFKDNETINEFSIDYIKEAQKDSILNVYYKNENNEYMVKITDSNNNTLVLSKLTTTLTTK